MPGLEMTPIEWFVDVTFQFEAFSRERTRRVQQTGIGPNTDAKTSTKDGVGRLKWKAGTLRRGIRVIGILDSVPAIL